MGFLIAEEYLPATLTSQPMTDDEFAAFCSIHPDLDMQRIWKPLPDKHH